MTAFWFIAACIAFIIVSGALRRRPGSALTDTAVLVFLFGLIVLTDLALGRFMDTGNTGWTVAALLAAAFALDALYGLMAPDRQKRRNRQLRQFMRRKRA